jgi:Kdo2-lipid IVA lauroyltransferase/acyltransferase
MLTRMGHLAVYLLVRVLLSLVQALSIESCAAAARALSILLHDVLRIRHKIVAENLATAFPHTSQSERRRIARRMWQHLLVMVAEIAHAPRKIHDSNWRNYIEITPKPELVGLMLEPRPRVCVTAHLGNFELGGYLTGLLGFPTFTVARTLDNPYLDAFVNRFRESKGQYILPKVGSAPQADAVLSTGGTLVLLGDQHAGPKGCWVEFMGRPASCHKAVALFTLLSGAPMLVVACTRRDRPMQFTLELVGVVDPAAAPCDALTGVQQLTQWYNDVLAAQIRRQPDQYWWLHRRWRDPPKRLRQKLAAPRQAA